MKEGRCQNCKGVYPHDQLFACVVRGDARSFIPWICDKCHEGCEGPYCVKYN